MEEGEEGRRGWQVGGRVAFQRKGGLVDDSPGMGSREKGVGLELGDMLDPNPISQMAKMQPLAACVCAICKGGSELSRHIETDAAYLGEEEM